MIPVIVEVAKEQKIRPCCPLSIAVVASQIAITASPVSAAVIYMSGVLEPFGWSYPALIGIWLVTTFAGCMLTAFVMTKIQNMDLDSDPVYKGTSCQRVSSRLVRGCRSDGTQAFCQALRRHLPDRRALHWCSMRPLFRRPSV